MIPRSGSKAEQLPSLRLYREDLDKLLLLFKERCQQVTIGDDEHLYESLDEMEQKNPDRLTSFILSGIVPHAELLVRGSYSVPLGVQRSTLWIAEKNDKSELLFLSAKEILNRRKWKAANVARLVILSLAVVLFFVAMFSKSITGPHHIITDLESNFTGLSAIILLVVGVSMHGKQVSYISLLARSKRESFWKRNSDKVILAVLSILFGAMGTLAVEWIKRVLVAK